jgi:hypothetical protein
LLGGNFYGVKPKRGRYDASFGTLLQGGENGTWTPLPPSKSHLYLEGQVRALRLLRRARGDNLVLVVRNNARPQLVQF